MRFYGDVDERINTREDKGDSTEFFGSIHEQRSDDSKHSLESSLSCMVTDNEQERPMKPSRYEIDAREEVEFAEAKEADEYGAMFETLLETLPSSEGSVNTTDTSEIYYKNMHRSISVSSSWETESIGDIIEEKAGCCWFQQYWDLESDEDDSDDGDIRRKKSSNRHSIAADQDRALRKERLRRKLAKMGPVAARKFKKRLMLAKMEGTGKKAPPKKNKGPNNSSNNLMKKQQEQSRQQEEKKKPSNSSNNLMKKQHEHLRQHEEKKKPNNVSNDLMKKQQEHLRQQEEKKQLKREQQEHRGRERRDQLEEAKEAEERENQLKLELQLQEKQKKRGKNNLFGRRK